MNEREKVGKKGTNERNRCFWCGKDQVSGFWSGKQRKYCSLRCAAAGEHRNALLIAIVSTPFTLLFLFFPEVMYNYFDAGYSSGGNPSFFALIAASGIMLVLVSMTSFSLYASYIGWSARRNANVVSIVDVINGHEQDNDALIFCVICGNPEVSTFWSNSRGYFCSFRCSAAGDYIRFLGMAITTLTLLFILIILGVIGSSQQPVTSSVPIIIVIPVTVIILFDLGFFYAAYIGWRIHHKVRLDTHNE